MSYLADHYRNTNLEAGHARDCGFGAGADCRCHVYEAGVKASVAKAREEYRALKIDSGLVWAEFTAECKKSVDADVEAGRVDTYEADAVAWAFVEAAKIVAQVASLTEADFDFEDDGDADGYGAERRALAGAYAATF